MQLIPAFFSLRERTLSSASTLVVLLSVLGGCDETSKGENDVDASSNPVDSGAKDAGSPDVYYWNCTETADVCNCDNRSLTRPESEALECFTSDCCAERVTPDGFRSCVCVTTENLAANNLTCDQRVAQNVCEEGDKCGKVDSCPDLTMISTDASTAVVDAGPVVADGGGNLPPPDAGTPSQGPVQSCTYDKGCLEFRDHIPRCYSSNKANCENVFSGVYTIGACPKLNYSKAVENDTSCGLTVLFEK